MIKFREVASFLKADRKEISRDRIPFDCIPLVARCMSMIANDGGRTPLKLYVRTDVGRIRIMPNSLGDRYERIAYVLQTKPNALQDAFSMKRQLFDELNRGVAYLVWDNLTMQVLPTARTYPIRNEIGGIDRYVVDYTEHEKKARKLDAHAVYEAQSFPASIVHVIAKELDKDGEPIMLAERFKATFGFGELLHSFATDFYGHGGVAKAYLTAGPQIDDDKAQSMKEKIGKWLFKTPDDPEDYSGGIAIVDGNSKLTTLSFTAQEAQLIEQRKEYRRDIADIFIVPEWAVGLLDDYKYNSLAASRQDYIGTGLDHLFERITSILNTVLFDEVEQQYFYVDFDTERLIIQDALAQAQIDDLRIKNTTMMPNESRRRNSQPELEGGDSLLVPVNMVSAEYQRENEALNLQIKRLELEALRQPEPAPPEDVPEPESEGMSNNEYMAELLTAQGGYVERLGALDLSGAEKDIRAAIDPLVREMMLVGWLWHAEESDALDRIATKVIKSIAFEIARDVEYPNIEYIVNRAINAGLHEGIKHAHGSTASTVWIGGEYDGQVLAVDDYYEGAGVKHPPVSRDNDLRSFIRRVEN